MNRTYTVGEIPNNRPFTVEGIDATFVRDGDFVQYQSTDTSTLIDFFNALDVNNETMTESVRPIFQIDPLQVVASFANTYLMRTPDGFIIETFDEQGEVHFEQYFQPQNLHRALSKLQSLMPEPIPEWANTEITRPDGSHQFTASDVYNTIRDTFFIGYNGTLNNVEDMERVLNQDGWSFNDLNEEQEVCFR